MPARPPIRISPSSSQNSEKIMEMEILVVEIQSLIKNDERIIMILRAFL